MAKTDQRQAWIKRRESATLAHVPGNARQAKRVFSGLAHDKQMTLVDELVDTRTAELCKAHADVVAVKSGYGTKRNKRTGRTRVSRTPCVTFVVKKKWRSQRDEKDDRALPKLLFTYCTVDRERKLCGIPTDVECASDYSAVRPQVRQIVVKKSGIVPELGAIACAVMRTGSPDKLYALSCRHVFSMTTKLHPAHATFATVHVDSSRNVKIVARVRSLRGKLTNGRSFDAQLAEVENRAELRRALQGLSVSSFAVRRNQFPRSYVIRAPGVNITASKIDFVPNWEIVYETPTGNLLHVSHTLLVESLVALGATKGGYSGSPVVTRDGKMLLGMHIAGGDTRAFMIPAWQLFDVTKYDGIVNSEVLGPRFRIR